MCNSHSTPSYPATEEPFRYARSETVRHLHERLHPDHEHQSGRDFATTAGLPHTTLRYWEQRQQHTDAPAGLVAFLESPSGLAFLKQLLLALHLIFQQLGIAGLRPLSRFLELAGLSPFVASSYGTHQRLAAGLQQALSC
jgi:Family of unknown function (DUF6399)